MDFAEFQKISRTILEANELAGMADVKHYDEQCLLRVLADASNKKKGEIKHIHVLAAMELKQRLGQSYPVDCAWEIAEIFRKIYSAYMDKHPYAHIDVEEEVKAHGILDGPKRLYLVSKHFLLWAHTNKKHELDSVGNAIAPLLLGEPTCKRGRILEAARLLKEHFLLGRFTEENLRKVHKVLASFEPGFGDEKIICAKAELMGIMHGEERTFRIEKMLKQSRKQPSFPATRKIESVIEQFSDGDGELQRPSAGFTGGPIRRKPNVHPHAGKKPTAAIIKKA